MHENRPVGKIDLFIFPHFINFGIMEFKRIWLSYNTNTEVDVKYLELYKTSKADKEKNLQLLDLDFEGKGRFIQNDQLIWHI